MITKNEKFFSAFIIVFTFIFISVWSIQIIVPSVKASDHSLPSGDLIQGLEIKNISVVEDFYNTLVSEYTIPDSTFSNCGWFAYVTKNVTVNDSMGWKGSKSFDDYCLVCLFCPLNQDAQGRLGVPDGTNLFGINDWENYPWRNNYEGGLRMWYAVGSIVGTGSNQSVETPFVVEKFSFDSNGGYPYNSEVKPYLYYNWGSGYNKYMVKDYFVDEGDISHYGSLDSISSAGLLTELYDISFIVQGTSDDKHSSLISRSLAVTPLAVRDDTGYNMIFLEVPQLETDLYHNDVIWGYYLFRPRYSSDKFYFNGLKLSFAYDPIEDSEDLDNFPAPSFFEASVNSQPLKSGGILTVNSLSWLYGGKTKSVLNREFSIFDYSSTDNNIYPTFMFHSIATSNRYSAGSFCYNFVDDGLMAVDDEGNSAPATPEQKQDLADSGNDRNEDTKLELGFVPYSVRFNSLNDSFSWDNSQEYDFSSVGSLLGSLFSNFFVITIATACCVVGLIGYVLYGKN